METAEQPTKVKLELTEKQLSLIQAIQLEKAKLQEEFNKLNARESTVLELVLDFNQIVQPKSVNLEGSTLVIEL